MYMCTSYAPIYDLPVCASTANAACISAFLLNQVSSGTLQFRWARPAVAAVTLSRAAVPKLWALVGLRRSSLPGSCSTPASFLTAVSSVDVADTVPALSGRASSHQLGHVYRSCSRNRSYCVAMPWNTDYSKKCILHLFFPHHSFILAFSL